MFGCTRSSVASLCAGPYSAPVYETECDNIKTKHHLLQISGKILLNESQKRFYIIVTILGTWKTI